MRLHETAKAGQVGCHTGDTHHRTFSCRGNRQTLGFRPVPISSNARRGGKSPSLPSNSDVYFVPGTVLSSLHVLTHLIFSITMWSETVIISILQMKKLRLNNLPNVIKPGNGVELGFEGRRPAPGLLFGTATLYCLSHSSWFCFLLHSKPCLKVSGEFVVSVNRLWTRAPPRIKLICHATDPSPFPSGHWT